MQAPWIPAAAETVITAPTGASVGTLETRPQTGQCVLGWGRWPPTRTGTGPRLAALMVAGCVGIQDEAVVKDVETPRADMEGTVDEAR